MRKLTYYGVDAIGLYSLALEDFALVPNDAPKKFRWNLKEELKVEIITLSIFGGDAIGIYGKAYENLLALPDILFEEEENILKEYGVDYVKVSVKWNALGNNLVFNHKRAWVSPKYTEKEVKEFEDVLGVEVERKELSGYKTPGSLLILTKRGSVGSYVLGENLREEVKEAFSLPYAPVLTSANFGTAFLNISIIANSKGVCVGSSTTGVEMARIEEGLLG